ncbi:MAG: 4Fe-4S binding protein, partial [Thermoplasmata archaeon]|nr:4Fe-4S binding protein [Thermoplasmata archaeon]
MRKEKRLSRPRLVVQIVMLVLVNSMLFGAASFGTSPHLKDIYLPNASTKFFQNAPTYSVIYKLQDTLEGGLDTLYMDLVIPFLIVIVLIMLLGRVWCAWLCPLGLPQDLLSKLRARLKIPYFELTPKVSTVLHQMKYVALFLIIAYTISLSTPVLGLSHFRSALGLPYEQLDPNRALYTYPQMALGLLPLTTAVPILSILSTIFFLVMCFKVRRFWCHICPAGAFMSFFNRRALIHIKKDHSKCTGCRICARVCPTEVKMVYEEKKDPNVTVAQCIHCYS